MSTKVFLSVGRTFTPAQEEFVSELESFLQANGLTAQTVGRTYFSNEQPLKAIMSVLRECSGAAILAFERVFIKQGCEKRGSPKESPLQETNLPTVWNQIEAAMAYTLGYPLLVIVDETLRTEGLLEMGYDWYVLRIPLTKESLREREFTGVFDNWRKQVVEHASRAAEQEGTPDASGGATRGVAAIGTEGGASGAAAPPPPDLLSNEIRKSLYDVLLDAYPDKEELRRCVAFGLDVELDEIAEGKTITETLFRLVSWARKTGRVEELMNAAYQYNPSNPRLKSFVLTTLGKLPPV
jgi:hypothetical protein